MNRERRFSPRHRAYLPVHLQPRDTLKTVDTLTKDISRGGLRCLSPAPFPVASEVRVELVLSAGQAPLTVIGNTKWFRTLPYSDMFEVGMSFVELPEETERRLSTYLDRLSGQPVPATV